MSPAFLLLSFSLLPVTFLHLPMVATVDPPVGNPTMVSLGWTIPAAGCPDVVIAFITVIAPDPHVTTIWWPATVFVHGPRWANADHNLRKRCRRAKCESKQECQCNLFHHESNPPEAVCFRGFVSVPRGSRIVDVSTVFGENSCGYCKPQPNYFYSRWFPHGCTELLRQL